MSKYKQAIQNAFPFSEFRINQEEIIHDIVESFDQITDHFVLESPTGVGKSAICFTVGKALAKLNDDLNIKSSETGPPILILSSTRQLQVQYIESFNNRSDFNHIWSAKNYECAEFPLTSKENIEFDVHFGSPLCMGAKKCIAAKEGRCEYLLQKEKFMSGQVGVTNYAYFMNSCTLKPKILVCDEAHNLQKILCDYATLSLSEDQLAFMAYQITKQSGGELCVDFKNLIQKVNKLTNNKHIKNASFQNPEVLSLISDYIDEAYNEINPIIKKLEILIMKLKPIKKYKTHVGKLNRVKENLTDIYDKYDMFLSSTTQWVYNLVKFTKKNGEESKSIEVKPLEVHEYFKSLIGDRVKKSLFMSASICGVNQFCQELGIPEYDFKQTGSTIPVENRTVHVVNNLGKLTYKNKDEMMPKFIITIDRILKYLYEKNDGKKINGIIHTVSYDNAERILAASQYASNMLIPNKKDLLNLDKVITEGKANVIVSPSIIEGVDLVDDLSRFQIFLKVPYQFIGDIWVKTKMNMNSKWYSRMAIIKIVQGCGRSIRSDKDWAETFILDGNFNRLMQYDNELFPEWFKESVRSYNIQI